MREPRPRPPDHPPCRGIISTTRFYGPRPVKGRLTGKQMFEADATLVFSDAAAEGDAGGGGGGGGGGGVAIDESLFAAADLEGLTSDDDDGSYEPSEGEEDSDEDE